MSIAQASKSRYSAGLTDPQLNPAGSIVPKMPTQVQEKSGVAADQVQVLT